MAKMDRIILSTSNIMNGSTSIARRPMFEKSNTELTSSLRANFHASQQAHEEQEQQDKDGGYNQSSWTQTVEKTLYIPRMDSAAGLAEERAQYDITVKLFFLPSAEVSRRSSQTEEAITLVLKELDTPSIDLLIVSFPGITFDADDDEYEGPNSASTETNDLEEQVQTWRALERLQISGVVRQIGLAEFGSERLQKFLPRTKVRPSVDQINVRDCCVVPKSLILYAKQEKIELLTHNDCTNILPKGTTRELLGPGVGAGVLSDGISDGLKSEVEPQWVVKYTAVVRDRGVIENKGYFALAEIRG